MSLLPECIKIVLRSISSSQEVCLLSSISPKSILLPMPFSNDSCRSCLNEQQQMCEMIVSRESQQQGLAFHQNVDVHTSSSLQTQTTSDWRELLGAEGREPKLKSVPDRSSPSSTSNNYELIAVDKTGIISHIAADNSSAIHKLISLECFTFQK